MHSFRFIENLDEQHSICSSPQFLENYAESLLSSLRKRRLKSLKFAFRHPFLIAYLIFVEKTIHLKLNFYKVKFNLTVKKCLTIKLNLRRL